jgi:hypothetical protein
VDWDCCCAAGHCAVEEGIFAMLSICMILPSEEKVNLLWIVYRQALPIRSRLFFQFPKKMRKCPPAEQQKPRQGI